MSCRKKKILLSHFQYNILTFAIYFSDWIKKTIKDHWSNLKRDAESTAPLRLRLERKTLQQLEKDGRR